MKSFFLLILLGVGSLFLKADDTPASSVYSIDLPMVLRLLGVQNINLQKLQNKIEISQLREQAKMNQLFPQIRLGLQYKGSQGRIQDVAGNIISVDKQSLSPGVQWQVQWSLGNQWSEVLQQRSQKQEALFAKSLSQSKAQIQTAFLYWDLLKAQTLNRLNEDRMQKTNEFTDQIRFALEAGLVTQFDLDRFETLRQKMEMAWIQSQEQELMTGLMLAKLLNLDPKTRFVTDPQQISPVQWVGTESSLEELQKKAMTSRPEVGQLEAFKKSVEASQKMAQWAPWIPTLNADLFTGFLGGGKGGEMSRWGDSENYSLGFFWNLGPGGIFDQTDRRLREKEVGQAALTEKELRQEIEFQIVEAFRQREMLQKRTDLLQKIALQNQRQFEAQKSKKEAGIVQPFEFFQSHMDYLQSQMDAAMGILSMNQAEFAMSVALGTTYGEETTNR